MVFGCTAVKLDFPTKSCQFVTLDFFVSMTAFSYNDCSTELLLELISVSMEFVQCPTHYSHCPELSLLVVGAKLLQ